ncbi:hypothetical protein ElyMa_006349800 [Elysia marginata]|uniref:Uncharacterized protein n=1 Tax=Elysia marginata TaxID=1093978 RepID=A0AAV4HJU8_9GAST|nr:hypothetical protein ElyMa_006349800 [Elysia marginata]
MVPSTARFTASGYPIGPAFCRLWSFNGTLQAIHGQTVGRSSVTEQTLGPLLPYPFLNRELGFPQVCNVSIHDEDRGFPKTSPARLQEEMCHYQTWLYF